MAAVPSSRPAASNIQVARAVATTSDLYERYRAQIFRFCLQRLRNREEAEDATQTTFLNAFRGLERGVDIEFESAWLYKIALHVCLSRQRSSTRRPQSAGDVHELHDVLPARDVESDELFRLSSALRKMP